MELSSENKKLFWNHYNTIDQDGSHDKKQRGETNRWRLIADSNLVLSRWCAEKDVGIFITIRDENGKKVSDALKQILSEKLNPYMPILEKELDAKEFFRTTFTLGKERSLIFLT